MFRDLTVVEVTFTGKSYEVKFHAQDASHRTTYRDMMGDDVEDWVTQWKGWVTVRDRSTKEYLAACNLGIHRGYDRKAIAQRIHVSNLVPGMEEAYADFIGRKIITTFKSFEGPGIPIYTLIYRFDDWKMEEQYNQARIQELLEAGLIFDVNGQRMFALK